MDVGMLWFDNDRNTDIRAKVTRAAEYYHKKYGQNPTVCFVHPSMVGKDGGSPIKEKRLKAGNIELRISSTMLPNHFWIGVNGNKKGAN